MDVFGEMLDLYKPYKEDLQHHKGDMPGIVKGTVKENWEKEHPGMVKVEYIQGEEGKTLSGWMPCMTFYGGENYGAYALPEIGSTVVVAFLGGNSSSPMVLGSLWPKEKLPENAANEKNTEKQFVTKKKNTLKMSDEDKKERIELSTPAGQKILMEGETQTVTITDKDGKNKILLDSKNGVISLDAEKKLTLCVGGKELLMLEKDKVTIRAGNVEAEGKQGLTLKGQTLGISGANTEVKSSAKLSVQSDGVTEIKGAMIKLN